MNMNIVLLSINLNSTLWTSRHYFMSNFFADFFAEKNAIPGFRDSAIPETSPESRFPFKDVL